MLIVTRRSGEKIMLGDDIVVHIMEIVGNSVRVAAPRRRVRSRSTARRSGRAVRDQNRAVAESAPGTSSPPC